MEQADIGIIGGSGFYDMPELENPKYIKLQTPFGSPSERVLLGKINGRSIAFLARHGIGHLISPSEINYRANLYALKLLNVQHLISVTAVGSLKEELKPTDMVIPDQYMDNTFKREKTFFEKGIVAHVSMAKPTCPEGSKKAFEIAKNMNLNVHMSGIYINMEGPQFSTLGESLTYRKMGFSIIGMTQAIEAKLARELEICFIPLAFVTDYDCWHEEEEAVSVEMVVNNLNKNSGNAKELIRLLASSLSEKRDQCTCIKALENAIITNPRLIPAKTYRRLEMIIGKYIKERI